MRSSLAIVGMLIFFLSPPARAQSGWFHQDSGLTNDLFAVHFTDLDHGYAVGAAGAGIRTTNAGASWQGMTMGVNVDLHGVFFLGAIGVAVGDGGTILRTTDSGSHWNLIPSGVTDGLLSVTLDGSNGICGGLSQTILYSTNAGASWLVSQTGFFGGGFAGTAMVSPQIAFVGGTNSIFQPLAGKSTDGGGHWSFHSFYLAGNEGGINAIDFTDANAGYAACRVWDGTGAIARTLDGGQVWSTLLFPGECNGIDFPVSDAGLVGYAVGASGAVRKTASAGASWPAQASGTTEDLHDVCFLDFDNGFAVGNGGTILKTTSGGEPASSVEGNSGGAEPAVLMRAFPNPFRGVTRIHSEIGPGHPTSIAVFDSQGRRVRTFGPFSGGTGNVSFDGRDEAGRPLGSGVYVVRLLRGLPGRLGAVSASGIGGVAHAAEVKVVLLQ